MNLAHAGQKIILTKHPPKHLCPFSAAYPVAFKNVPLIISKLLHPKAQLRGKNSW